MPTGLIACTDEVFGKRRAERRGLDIGRPPEHHLHLLMNAVLYVGRTGVP